MASELLPFCKTDTQKGYIEAIIKHKTQEKAAQSLGINVRNLKLGLKRVKRNAEIQGYSPENGMTRTAPDSFHVKGVSTLYGKDGNISSQWVKTHINEDIRIKVLIESLQDSFDDYTGKSIPVSSPRFSNRELLAVYPLGDPHIGMYAWSEEAGDDFDCDIASSNLRSAIRSLVGSSPNAETALILNLGDYFHADNLDNRTRASGNVLDVDTRWPKVLRVGVDLLIECVYAALEKHKKVIVKNVTGNHDDHSSVFLGIALEKYFSKNKRVIVDSSPSRHWYYRFGKVLIGSTHGNTSKPDNLPGIMAADRSKDWGETEYRYWYTGHIHSKNVMEFPGVTWESFRTLAAKDAWHASQGYRSLRDMQCIIHHKEYGEVGRNIVNIAMIKKSTK